MGSSRSKGKEKRNSEGYVWGGRGLAGVRQEEAGKEMLHYLNE